MVAEGDNIGPLANKRVRLREVKADMLGYTCELMAKVAEQNLLDVPLSAEDKERFLTFLVTEGYLDSADRAYKKTTARGPGDPHDLPFPSGTVLREHWTELGARARLHGRGDFGAALARDHSRDAWRVQAELRLDL